jgi:6-phosphogluconolactonase
LIEQLVFDSAAELTRNAAKRLAEKLQEPRGADLMRVLLTGGTLGIQLLEELSKLNLDLEGVQFYFGDERFVGFEDKDRNEAQGLAVWPELAKHLHRFPEPNQDLEQARVFFDTQLSQDLGPLDAPGSSFDLVVLGMGPDGHVASLFPGAQHDFNWIVAEPNSPKPPAMRLSFSYEALNRSSEVWFLVSGEAKAEAVRCALSDDCDLPAGQVRGLESTLWFMDAELRRAL